MPNSQAMATSFKTELLLGYHCFNTGVRAADTFKAALFTTAAAANLGATTTTYTAAAAAGGEVSGSGYTAGGVNVPAFNAPAATGTTAFVQPSASIVYTNVTLATSFDAVLIYNSTQGNRAVSVHTFTAQTIAAGTLTLTMPTNDATNALIRLT